VRLPGAARPGYRDGLADDHADLGAAHSLGQRRGVLPRLPARVARERSRGGAAARAVPAAWGDGHALGARPRCADQPNADGGTPRLPAQRRRLARPAWITPCRSGRTISGHLIGETRRNRSTYSAERACPSAWRAIY